MSTEADDSRRTPQKTTKKKITKQLPWETMFINIAQQQRKVLLDNSK